MSGMVSSSNSNQDNYSKMTAKIEKYLYNKPDYTLPNNLTICNQNESLINIKFTMQLCCLLGSPAWYTDKTDKMKTSCLAELYEEISDDDNKYYNQCENLAQKMLVYPEMLVHGLVNKDIDKNDAQKQAKGILRAIKRNLEEIYVLAIERSKSYRSETAKSLQLLFSQMDMCLAGLLTTLEVIKGDLCASTIKTVVAKLYQTNIESYNAIFMAKAEQQNKKFNDIETFQAHNLRKLFKIAETNGYKTKFMHNTHRIEDIHANQINFSSTDVSEFLLFMRNECSTTKIIQHVLTNLYFDIYKVFDELDINHKKLRINYNDFESVQAKLIATFKLYGIIDISETDINHHILNVEDMYTELEDYTIKFEPAPDTMKEKTIYCYLQNDDYLNESYRAKYLFNGKTRKTTLDKQFVDYYKNNKDVVDKNFSEELNHDIKYQSDYQIINEDLDSTAEIKKTIAQQTSCATFINLPYFTIKALQGIGVCTEGETNKLANSTLSISISIFDYRASYRDKFWIYFTEHGIINRIDLSSIETIKQYILQSKNTIHSLLIFENLIINSHEAFLLDLINQLSDLASKDLTYKILFMLLIHGKHHFFENLLLQGLSTSSANIDRYAILPTIYNEYKGRFLHLLTEKSSLNGYELWLRNSDYDLKDIEKLIDLSPSTDKMLILVSYFCETQTQIRLQQYENPRLKYLYNILLYRCATEIKDEGRLLPILKEIYPTNHTLCNQAIHTQVYGPPYPLIVNFLKDKLEIMQFIENQRFIGTNQVEMTNDESRQEYTNFVPTKKRRMRM